jgi:hypothetical protein
MTILSFEERQALAQNEGQPARVEDPETKTAHLVVREDWFHQIPELLAVEKADLSL